MRQRERLLGASGVLFFLVLIAVLAVPHDSVWPDQTRAVPSAEKVASFFAEEYAMQQFQTVMHSLAMLILLVFAGILCSLLRPADAADGRWTRIAFGAVAAIAAIDVVAMGLASAAVTFSERFAGEGALFAYAIAWSMFAKVNYLLPAFLLPVGELTRRSGLLPRWLGWTAIVVGALSLLSTLGNLSENTWFAQYPIFMLFIAWVLVTGVVVLLRGVTPVPRTN